MSTQIPVASVANVTAIQTNGDYKAALSHDNNKNNNTASFSRPELVRGNSGTAVTTKIRQLLQGNELRYGDEIRLKVRSNYTKLPKPVWLDPTQQGWTFEEKAGGCLGVYTKQDGTSRVMVPPLGNHATGQFTESYFRVEDPRLSQEQSYGSVVSYGDTVVLIDDNNLVWNNKTGGLFWDGYLTPKPRGEPGEIYVSFQKNGHLGEPVIVGDVGVFINVEDSHRHLTQFNNRLTNYKTASSSVLGGYVCSDGSGEPLLFVVDRFKGKVKARVVDAGAGSPLLKSGEKAEVKKEPSSVGEAEIKLKSISVFNDGVKDIMTTAPSFGKGVLIYGLKRDSQIEILLSDSSTAVLDFDSLALDKSECHVDLKNANGEVYARLDVNYARDASYNNNDHSRTPRATPVSILLALAKLIAAYAFFYFLILAVYVLLLAAFEYLALGHAEVQVWGMFKQYLRPESDDPTNAHRKRPSVLSRVAKRVLSGSLFFCLMSGFLLPRVVLKSSQQPESGNSFGATFEFKISMTRVEVERKQSQTDKTPPSKEEGSVDVSSADSRKGVNKYRNPGVDQDGTPLNFAYMRFLNGENGNRDTALARWNITCDWREENNIDDMLDRGHRLFFLIKAHYPHFFYGRSKLGHPIYIEQLGKVNMKALRAGGAKLKDMIYHYIYTAEFMWNISEPAEYASSITILDVAGIGFRDFAGEVIEFVKKATQVVQEHYPERGNMVFIVNVPIWFSAVWNIVKVWVNPRTREKIKILGSDFKAELHKVVPPENLPADYQGTNPVALDNSVEERLMRNVAVRGILKSGITAIGPDGNALSRRELEAKIDESVDAYAYRSQMSKVGWQGQPLCDASGRPLPKKW